MHGELVGQVLLHGDLDAQPRVLAKVGHPEPANAQDSHHAVGAKPEAGRQRSLMVVGAHGRTMQQSLRARERPPARWRKAVEQARW